MHALASTPTANRPAGPPAWRARAARPALVAAAAAASPPRRGDSSPSVSLAVLTLGAFAALAALEPGVAAAAADRVATGPGLGDLAENQDFWSNVARYGSFFFSVLLGTAATAVKPVIAALKKSPASAAGVLAAAGLALWFVSTTVGLMLGVGDGGSGPDDLGAFLDGVE